MSLFLYLGAFISLGFLGLKVYDVVGELQWSIPIWLMALFFGWELFDHWMRDYTPWRRQ